MKNLESINKEYLPILTDRAKKSKVYKSYQLTGLTLAELLEDDQHKSLYIRLAKKYSNDYLLKLAKNIAEKKSVTNKGAYFMSVFFQKTHTPNNTKKISPSQGA